jgi:hypothetical protein
MTTLMELVNDIKALSDDILKDKPKAAYQPKVISVLVKTHYGSKHYYPTNDVAKLFLAVQGGKVLTAYSMKVLREAGYEMDYQYEEEEQ